MNRLTLWAILAALPASESPDHAYQAVGDVAIAYTSDIHDAVEKDDSYANITMVFEFDPSDEYQDFDDIWTGTYSETINLKFVAL